MAVLLYKWLLLFSLPLFSVNKSETGAGPAAPLHPFYISVTEIHHNAGDKTLEISCKIFVDDLEEVLKQNFKTKVNLTDDKAVEQNNRMISEYITRRLALQADGRGVQLNFLGYEKDKESAWCYFEATGLPIVKKLDVTNSLLQDLTDQQINIMHVTVGGKRKSHKLDFPAKQVSFLF